MARLETAVLTASEIYARNHQAQSARVETLRARIAEATSGGRLDMVERHRKRGKLLVRARRFWNCRRSRPTGNTAARCPVRGS